MNGQRRIVSRWAFTLIEMLAAMAVLSLLLVLIFSVVGSALKLSDSTSRGADNANEANQVLDRIGADISAMLIRPDLDQFYYKATGNDKMFFYSQQTGFFDSTVVTEGQSPFSLIGYRVNTTGNAAQVPMLERLAQGLIWDKSSNKTVTAASSSGVTVDPNGTTGPLTFLNFGSARTSPVQTLTATTATTIPGQWTTAVGATGSGTSVFYNTIGNQIFRLEICFQLQNGSFSQYPGYTNSAPVYPIGLSNTSAVVVAIAVLDSKSRKLVPAASWAKMITALGDATDAGLGASPPQLMDSTWNTALQQSTFANTVGIPAQAAAKIKVYQRYYYLNSPKAQ